jgi:type II secretory pathway pseudopilin PulG
MNRRPASFTIIEMIMALLISSVVIGIVYYVYLLLNHQLAGYQSRASVMSEYILFQKALRTDMDWASAIDNPAPNEVQLHRSDGQAVHYNFYQQCIVRSMADNRDSFRLPNKGCQVIPVSDSIGLVQKLVLDITVAGMPMQPVFTKQYSACELLQPVYNHE